jgi:hypothetical protein
MLKEIAYYNILSRPIVFWAGILTITSVFFTALIAFLNKKGINKIPFRMHPKMAVISLIFALLHDLLALSFYLNF